MANNLNVSVIVGLVDRLSAPLKGLARNLERVTALTANMTFVGDALGRTGQALLAPLQDAARAAMSFESAMADVKKVVDFPTPEGPAQMARDLERLDFSLVATRGTAVALRAHGLACETVHKVGEGRPHIVDLIKNDQIALIVNTTEGKQAIADSFSIRREALMHKVSYTTTLAAARATCQALREFDNGSVNCLQDLHLMEQLH